MKEYPKRAGFADKSVGAKVRHMVSGGCLPERESGVGTWKYRYYIYIYIYIYIYMCVCVCGHVVTEEHVLFESNRYG